jgi:hypothetical protein
MHSNDENRDWSIAHVMPCHLSPAHVVTIACGLLFVSAIVAQVHGVRLV